MTRPSRRLMILLLLGCMPAAAETLHCRSINGNVTCSGDGGVSCQTVNGRTTCVGGGGSVVQEFGGAPGRKMPGRDMPDEADEAPEEWPRERPRERPEGQSRERLQPPARSLAMERRGPAGFLSVERDGTRLRLRTERLSIDRD